MNTNSVPPEIDAVSRSLLEQSGWGTLETVVPLAGGRNNRVYRVVSSSFAGILKQYHRSQGSGRDRFSSELSWYRYCQSLNIEQVPKLYCVDVQAHCALFSEISGRKLVAGEVKNIHVTQAAEFFSRVNEHRDIPRAAHLPLAADACFSIDDYVNQVENRLGRLNSVPVLDALTSELRTWLAETLVPLWHEVRRTIEGQVAADQFLAVRNREERCLSPSDFGFHNALLTPAGSLIFLDFEYAGWDDPAKMICDFYWQVEVPAPRDSLPTLLEATSSYGGGVRDRVRSVFPLMGIKWCAIVLNEFIDDGRDRREFAAGTALLDSIRDRQLKLANRISNDVRELLRYPVC